MKLYEAIAQAIGAMKTSDQRGNKEWADRWERRLDAIARNELPSGSGFDSGTTIDAEKSRDDLIVLETSYHHMSEYGCYDGWTEHTIRVYPSFIGGFGVRIGGRDRDMIKDYIGDVFSEALNQEYTFPEND